MLGADMIRLAKPDDDAAYYVEKPSGKSLKWVGPIIVDGGCVFLMEGKNTVGVYDEWAVGVIAAGNWTRIDVLP